MALKTSELAGSLKQRQAAFHSFEIRQQLVPERFRVFLMLFMHRIHVADDMLWNKTAEPSGWPGATMESGLHEFLSSDNIGFHDSMKRSTSEDFNGNYRKLAAFKKRFGHCRVPSNWPEDRTLAAWVERQRNQWDHLSMNELARLFRLGVRFGYRPDQWIAQMVDLMAFQAEHGHVNVSQKDPTHGGLGKWCSKK